MRILATFDGTPLSEATLPLLTRLLGNGDTKVTLLAVADVPGVYPQISGEPRAYMAGEAYGGGTPGISRVTVRYPETQDQAIQRARSDLEDYLWSLAGRLPVDGRATIEAHVSDNPARVIIQRARELSPDVIVMATHSRHGLMRVFIGSTTEQVIASGVAPVLVVHPEVSVE